MKKFRLFARPVMFLTKIWKNKNFPRRILALIVIVEGVVKSPFSFYRCLHVSLSKLVPIIRVILHILMHLYWLLLNKSLIMSQSSPYFLTPIVLKLAVSVQTQLASIISKTLIGDVLQLISIILVLFLRKVWMF